MSVTLVAMLCTSDSVVDSRAGHKVLEHDIRLSNVATVLCVCTFHSQGTHCASISNDGKHWVCYISCVVLR